MFHQKMLLNVCLTATLVTLVAGQGINFNPQQCAQTMSKAVTEYIQQSSSQFNTFARQMTQLGVQASDVSQMQSEFEQLTQSLTQFTDSSQSFSAERFTSSVQQIMTFQVRMARFFINPSVGMKAMSLYTDFGMNMARQNLNFINTVPGQCMRGGQ